MLKIIITDVHMMPPDVLKETGAYLLRLAGCTDPIAHMVHSSSPNVVESLPVLSGNSESAVNSVPCVSPVKTMDGHDVSPGTKILHVPSPDIIEETLEHVPAETLEMELDATGLPWDARIHTRTRSKTIDGIWKLQRNIDMKKVDTVMKEIKQVMALPPGKPVAPVSPPVAPIAPVRPMVAPVSPPPVPVAPASPAWPSSPTAVPVTPMATDPVNDPCPADFNTFIGRISKHIAKGLIGHHQVKAICEQHGVPSLPLVASRPDLIPQIAAAIDLVAGA